MKTNKTKYIILVSSVLLAITACTSVTLLPPKGNELTVIANANSENGATKIATDKATRICLLQNKKIKILDIKNKYQGANKNEKELIKFAKTLLPASKTSGSHVPTKYQHKTILTFKCN